MRVGPSLLLPVIPEPWPLHCLWENTHYNISTLPRARVALLRLKLRAEAPPPPPFPLPSLLFLFTVFLGISLGVLTPEPGDETE